jgi:hypothetical protein
MTLVTFAAQMLPALVGSDVNIRWTSSKMSSQVGKYQSDQNMHVVPISS